MTSKTFSVAGVSTHPNGQTKVRFAKDFVSRFKILNKNKHTDIRLIELGGEFTKAEICKILFNHTEFQDELAQTAVTSYVTQNAPGIAKELTTPKVEEEIAESV